MWQKLTSSRCSPSRPGAQPQAGVQLGNAAQKGAHAVTALDDGYENGTENSSLRVLEQVPAGLVDDCSCLWRKRVADTGCQKYPVQTAAAELRCVSMQTIETISSSAHEVDCHLAVDSLERAVTRLVDCEAAVLYLVNQHADELW